MKKLILSLATLAPMFAGCQKPELEGTAHDEKQAFVASVEGFGAQTRTSLAPGNYVVWSSGDCLAIFQGSSIADEYILAEGSAGLNSGSFKWVADNSTMNGDFSAGTELPCNVAFYPYSDDLNLTGDMEDNKTGYVLSNVVLPNTQVYSANSFGNGAFPMVAVTENMEDHNLKFKNVLGAMKLQFKGNIAVKSIKVEGANGEKLSGAAKVTAYANNLTPAITMTGTDEVSKSVTLDCGDGAQLNTTEATDFFIALPPVLFQNGFTVIVTDVEKKEYTVTATDVNTVLRSSILVMPEITIESEDVENPEGGSGDSGNGYDYVDEYGINLGPGVDILGVVWAPVNCGYHANDYQWGKLYQWGRKYGQGYSGDLYDADDNITGLTSDATVPEFFQGPVSLEVGQSENNKNIFFISDNNDVYWDWLSPKDMTLWRSTSIKSEYDPCPEGWRVPTYSELNLLWEGSSAYWTTNDSGQSGCLFCGPSKYTDEVSQVFFPAAGSRYNYNGNANYRGQNGCYWSSYGSEIHGSDYLWFTKDKTAITELGDSRGSGYSVRCVHESSEVMEFIGVSEVKLSSTSLVLYEEGNAQLTAKVGPVDATNKTVVWRSWDSSIATVDQTGLVTAISEGTTRITATVGSCNTNCSVEVKPKRVVLDYVDEYGINHGKGTAIGMAIWAPVNCGYHVTDYQWGKLYQWGRKYGQGYDGDATTPEFSEGGVSLQDGQSSKNENVFFTCQDFPYDWLYQGDDQLWNSGTEDSPVKTEYDPCPAGWRVPTYAELEELSQNHSEWTINENSQSGCWFSGASLYSESNLQVFFPGAGYRSYYSAANYRGTGFYWSSRPDSYYAYYLCFGSSIVYMEGDVRVSGCSVRCVQNMSDESIPVPSVALNLTSLKLQEGDVQQLTATISPQDATDKSVVWSSSDASVATVDQTGRVTAVSAGSATITAVAGVKSAFCTVTVIVPVDYVDEYGINQGQGVKIGETVWAPVNCGYHATDFKYGKLYQWGRKYGQGYNGRLYDVNGNRVGTYADSSVPTIEEGVVSLQGGQSAKNENVFFTSTSEYYYDWLYPQDNYLWNSGTESEPVKTENDPCPAGWRVPTYAELEELSQNHSEWTINENSQSGCWFSGSSSYSSEVAQVFFPAAGYRYYNYGTVDNRGYSGNFWSSRANWESACYLGFNDGLTDMSNYGTVRAYGYSVRCVQD